MDIGIIGHGRIGKLLSHYLSRDFDVYVYDKNKKQVAENNKLYQFTSLEEVCSKRIILPLVPISDFEETIEAIKNKINKNAIVIDACSVKEFPIKIMIEKLPESVGLIIFSCNVSIVKSYFALFFSVWWFILRSLFFIIFSVFLK